MSESDSPSTSEVAEMLRGLHAVQWLRRATWFCLGFPVFLTGLIVRPTGSQAAACTSW